MIALALLLGIAGLFLLVAIWEAASLIVLDWRIGRARRRAGRGAR